MRIFNLKLFARTQLDMKKLAPKILLLLGMLLLQIGLAYAVITFLLPAHPPAAAKQEPQPEKKVAVEPKETTNTAASDTLKETAEEDVSPELLKNAAVLRMDDMIINPAQSGGSRYLLLSIIIYFKGKEAQEQLNLKEPAIYDSINGLIARHTAAWLSDPYNREILREKIKRAVKAETKGTEILKIYFTKFVMQ